MSTNSKQIKQEPRKKITARSLIQKKQARQKITMLTAYDYPMASLLDRSGLDVILVGDSLGMVVLGYENTLPVTMDDMLHHCKAVARGSKNCLLVGDLPFMSYQISIEEAVRNAGRLMQEGGMGAVKLEGGRERVATIKAIVDAGIPVVGHIGLTPQSIHKFGGFKTQGKTSESAIRIIEDALLLQEAGCFAIVLESIPAEIGKVISESLEIPTIGIGAGLECDGQVLVFHDVVGMFDRFQPKFSKQYVNAFEFLGSGISQYIHEVRQCVFPAADESVFMAQDEYAEVLRKLRGEESKNR
jgi:3-methyl-2-oxobutanoate hydroxymethyltransferase